MPEIIHHDLTDIIISCAYEVHNILGSGFLEKVYENALFKEIKARGLAVDSQVSVKVDYKGTIVGDFTADLVVENKIIIELKAIEQLIDIHELQLKNYLKATGIEVGLLVNFGKKLEVKRKYVEAKQSI